MALYNEEFPVGTTVRIASHHDLKEFLRTWKYHHKLTPEQIEFADRVVEVEQVSFYHGGDVLYQLRGVSGLWHEQCLRPARETEDKGRESREGSELTIDTNGVD